MPITGGADIPQDARRGAKEDPMTSIREPQAGAAHHAAWPQSGPGTPKP